MQAACHGGGKGQWSPRSGRCTLKNKKNNTLVIAWGKFPFLKKERNQGKFW
jgi:hypothetical protein